MAMTFKDMPVILLSKSCRINDKDPKTMKQQHMSCEQRRKKEDRVVNLPQQIIFPLQEMSEMPQDIALAGLKEPDLTVGSAPQNKTNYLTC